LTEKSWTEIVFASRQLSSLQNLMDHFKDHLPEWKEFYDSPNPQDAELPQGWEKLEYVVSL
jgi:hypothetical protein